MQPTLHRAALPERRILADAISAYLALTSPSTLRTEAGHELCAAQARQLWRDTIKPAILDGRAVLHESGRITLREARS